MVDKRCAAILKMSEDKTLEFISLYAKEECLWKTDSEFYTNKTARAIATQNIAAAIKLPKFEAKHVMIKIRNLRNSYCQELKKLAASIELGGEHKSRLVWFNLMDSFLRDYLKNPRFDHAIIQKLNEQLDESVKNNNVCDHVNNNSNCTVNSNESNNIINDVDSNVNNYVNENVNSNLNNYIITDVNSNVSNYVNNDVSSNLTNYVISDVNSNVSNYVNIDVDSNVNNYVNNDVNSNVNNYVNNDVTSNVNNYVNNDVTSNVNNYVNNDVTSNVNNYVNNDVTSNVNDIINNDIPVVLVNPAQGTEDDEWYVIGDPEPIEEMYSEEDLTAISTSDIMVEPMEPLNKRPREEDCIDPLLLNKDYFDDFGQYISSLLRVLPLKKAMALQPQIISMITNAALEID